MFHECQGSIQRIGRQSRSATKQEQRLLKNVMSSLAVSLQDLSLNFRKGQSSYLKSKYLMFLFAQNIVKVLLLHSSSVAFTLIYF